MHTDTERCLRAVQSKDARFDGWFYTAVLTTRIYCRPSCPVVPPKPENMRFYPSAAAAQQAGFRACKRCRPDASPGSPQWDERADLVARAMRLVADGIVDREGVPGLAARLGYSTRQIERQLLAELGAGPLALARAQRAQTARLLVETTALPMADVAFAAGFASIRTFNETVREVFALSPTELRQRARPGPRAVVPGALALGGGPRARPAPPRPGGGRGGGAPPRPP
ncbi:bifunctional transcriptional activator/DNA repair enzyme AdaA, partial [Streptomyces inhibens]|uniref:bifunctional transcriptional activator/DNA repair enzyme AdaA n=1 Tax=Streptomyces inhibens TaxID=2293571 RepID=UPI0036CE92CF